MQVKGLKREKKEPFSCTTAPQKYIKRLQIPNFPFQWNTFHVLPALLTAALLVAGENVGGNRCYANGMISPDEYSEMMLLQRDNSLGLGKSFMVWTKS